MKLPVDLHRLFAKLACWADLNRHRISVKLQFLRVADNQNQAYVILQTMVCLSNEMEKNKNSITMNLVPEMNDDKKKTERK